MSEDSPIFVRGYSRSGGTLMVTILDAHPEIAMSYELYPNLLAPEDGDNIDIREIIGILESSRNNKTGAKKISTKNLGTFIIRCSRGGLSNKDVARLLNEHLADGLDFSDVRGRMKFIERCCVEKMKKEGKSRWGLKCNNQYSDYVSIWPDAYFLNMIRDGRDVLASQLNTGSFNKNPAEIAKGWVSTLMRFREIKKNRNVHAYEVYYEKLVSSPEEEIKRICDYLNIPFNEAMLSFYKQDLTIYSRETDHLSMNRIRKPIDSSKVGRWEKDVNKKQLEEFYSVARDAMIKFGYLGEGDADRP